MRLSGYNGKSAKPSYCRLISTVSNWVSVAAGPLKDQSRIGQVEAGNRLSGVLDYFADSRLLEHLLRRGVEEIPSKMILLSRFAAKAWCSFVSTVTASSAKKSA